MLETLVVLLIILWLLGVVVFPIAGNAIHVLLFLVVVLLIVGRR